MDKPKWKKFEELVFQIQKNFAQDSEVKLDDSILGQDSKQSRQIDISIRKAVGQYNMLIVIDCKDYKEPVDVKDIGEFSAVLKDTRANKGAMISSSGFTKAALEMAKTYGIDALRLVDTKSLDWKTYASVPVMLERTFTDGFRFVFSGFASLPVTINTYDVKNLKVYDENNTLLGTLADLLARYWNQDKEVNLVGEQKVLLADRAYLEIDGRNVQMRIEAVLYVKKCVYVGNLAVDLQGFKNEHTGGVMTREITTDKIYPAQIEAEVESGSSKNWKKIADPEKLSIKIMMSIAYRDMLPTSMEAKTNL